VGGGVGADNGGGMYTPRNREMEVYGRPHVARLLYLEVTGKE